VDEKPRYHGLARNYTCSIPQTVLDLIKTNLEVYLALLQHPINQLVYQSSQEVGIGDDSDMVSASRTKSNDCRVCSTCVYNTKHQIWPRSPPWKNGAFRSLLCFHTDIPYISLLISKSFEIRVKKKMGYIQSSR
jgi:hypothetical protein